MSSDYDIGENTSVCIKSGGIYINEHSDDLKKCNCVWLEDSEVLMLLDILNSIYKDQGESGGVGIWNLKSAGIVKVNDNLEDPPHDERLDKGIAPYVEALLKEGVETFESCQGGEGHSYPEPSIRFHGDRSEGFRVLAIAIRQQLPIKALRRIWTVDDGEPTGPYWEMVFYVSSPSIH